MTDSQMIPSAGPEAPAAIPPETPVMTGSNYNEAYTDSGTPRAHWQSILSALSSATERQLKKSQDRVRRMRHVDGATFNLFDDAGTQGVPWELEMIPLPIPAGEWAALEAGLLQRAHLLEVILADIYGPRKLLADGGLPPALVFSNPRFLRPCHGIQPLGNRFLTFYAADIYRASDGGFRVLRDFGGNPEGMGYALENRIVISRVFSERYHQAQIKRLAPFFQTFHRSMTQRTPPGKGDPGIVLLSPGPDSRIYFEHALLSRYMGYPLVESQDLTVRNGRVFLKKLAGLEPVEIIFRHIPDENSDPFALRSDTVTGVAGLLQAARERNIGMVNPVGSGFLETPALPAFLPGLCQSLLGEDLKIPSHPTWWCGTETGRSHVLANLGELQLAAALERPESFSLPPDPVAAIHAAPHAFMASDRVRPSVSPAWNGTGVHSRLTLLRVFVCATEQGFAVMPGGLAITADDVVTLLGGCRERLRSKDIWVLSDRPVEPFSLLSGLQTATEFSRSSDLPSRVADHLLWLGRYMERAESLIRLLRSVFRRISGEARLQDIPELPFLLGLLRKQHYLPQPGKGGSLLPRFRELTAQLTSVLQSPDSTESVSFILKQVREAARNVRDRLSLDSWRAINRLENFADGPMEDPIELLDDTLFALNAFSGFSMESMTRGLGWRFMDMGRRVERAIGLTGLLRNGLPQICRESRNTLEALLEVTQSIMTYRARYRTTFQLAPVLDLLIMDETNPKSLAFQCKQLADHMDKLPRQNDRRFGTHEERMALKMLTSVRLLDLTGLDCRKTEPDSLAVFLETMENQLLEFAQLINAHYLSRVPATPHFALMSDERIP